MVSCLKPPRDNEFDPNNPDKAYLSGRTYCPEGPLSTIVNLIKSDTIIYLTDTSGGSGFYEFKKIDPGIYKILARAPYYKPVEIYPESLPAGTENDTFDIYLCEMYFNFDDEAVGTQEPFGFIRKTGNWQVVEDNQEPGKHTVPNVYNCDDSLGVALFNKPVANFYLSAIFKISVMTMPYWKTGFLLRYQNENNYYVISIDSANMALLKIINGTPQMPPIGVVAYSFSKDTWYYLEADVYDNHFRIKLNYEEMIVADDNTFSEGSVGFWVFNNPGHHTSVDFDDFDICR